MIVTDIASDVWETLHLARVRGLLSDEHTGAAVDDAVSVGFLQSTRVGYMLTPDGLAVHRETLDQWRKSVDLPLLEKTYGRFLRVNTETKGACSAWQTSARDDAAASKVADELEGSLDRVRPALKRAGAIAGRFDAYGERLAEAHLRAAAGDVRYFTDPTIDSFHTVWFECHEDYLVTLGRSREEEGSH